MNEEQNNSAKLLDTTDNLEAMSVFRSWKNFLFVLVLLSLIMLQLAFWLVNTGYVKTTEKKITITSAPVAVVETKQPAQKLKVIDKQTDEIKQASKEVAAAEPDEVPVVETQGKNLPTFDIKIRFAQLAQAVRIINFILVILAVLYCLTTLFCLKISMLGRLGGIKHIARAFFASLVFLVILLPWQRVFPAVVAGVIYTPDELAAQFTKVANGDIFAKGYLYLRFTGYWLVAIILLVFSFGRSCRWAKNIFRRLEVI